MNILINALILSNRNTGLGVYTFFAIKNVCPKLKKNNISFDIACNKKEYLPLELQRYAIEVEFSNFVERNKGLNNIIKKQKYDLIWSTTQHGKSKISIKQIITIHDLTPLLFPKGRYHQYFYYKFILPRVLKKTSSVITVSNNTKADIVKHYKIDSSKIKTIYESINDNKNVVYNDEVLTKYGVKNNEYYCVTGIHYYYKNLQIIIEAFNKKVELKKFKVIFIGNDNCEYGLWLKDLISKYHLDDNFIFSGFIDEKDKNSIIKNSIASVYPSKYEGFGLPLLEAMKIGTPVICSNSSSLPEVGGDAALYFNADSADELYDQMIKINDLKVRNEYINKGYENFNRFSWDKCSDEILEHIIKVLSY